MRRRGRGHGNIFGGSEPQDAVPDFDEFIRTRTGLRRPLRYRGLRDAPPPGYWSARRFTTHAMRPTRTWVLVVRIVICSIVLVLGMTGVGVGLAQAVNGDSDAGEMANAPDCNATSGAACTVSVVLTAGPGGVIHGGSEETIELDYPATGDGFGGNFVFVSYPGDAQFDAVICDGTNEPAVRAEYWNGQIVTLTAGSQGVTVTTDLNPNNQGGIGLGGALLSFALVLISVLMFVGIRAIRLRWLRPGVVLRLFVSGAIVLSLGTFVAGVCLISQPARVALVAAIAPPITLGVTGLLWLALRSGLPIRVRPVSAIR